MIDDLFIETRFKFFPSEQNHKNFTSSVTYVVQFYILFQ